MNLTFGPMHIVGLQGQPRRTYTYEKGYGWDFWNLVETIGAFIIAVSVLVFIWNIISSYRRYVAGGREKIVGDPWDARSLEWLTPNPTPHHNFDEIPTVTHQDEFWHRKYAEDEQGRPVAIAPSADVVQRGDAHPHLPGMSYWPILLAFGLPIVGYGLIYNIGLALVGAFIVFTAIYGWVLEPAFEGGHGDGHHDEHEPDDDGDRGAEAVASDVEPATEADSPETKAEEITEENPVG
jgi:cytochrome c oxidase subunit 1